MKKSFLKVMGITLALTLVLLSVFTGCTPKDELEENVPVNVVVNNTGANSVSNYNKETANYTLNIDAGNKIHDISDLLFGIFFEDINFAADGGLYAEMVANRSFEFTALAQNDNLYNWNVVNNADIKVTQVSKDCLNENNPSYLIMKNSADSFAGIENKGFLDGMALTKDATYNLTFYAKTPADYKGNIQANLAVDGKVVGSATVEKVGNEWQKYSAKLTSSVDAEKGVTLQILIGKGEVHFDMISLFPEDTFKGRENGLRKDLGQLLEDMQPKFLRFPGGCVIEGYDEITAYDWKDSIGVGKDGLPLLFNGKYGDVATRSQGTSIWTDLATTEDPYPSFFSYGLGFYEYFLLCEDIGAIGVPVLNCGLYCQMRGKGPVGMDTPEFKQYVQDMLDLVEFCRGDANSTWGKVRASLGHTEPFELKYICIGNENEGQDYFERYSAFLKAFNEAKAKNPKLYEGLELIYSSGAADAINGWNHIPSYEYAKAELDKMGSTNAKDFAGAVDQHYYNEPEWFLKHADYYDENNYTRTVETMTDTIYGGAIKIFLGEYAARSNLLKSALAEGAYMTGLERNGDIVEMAAYAPLFSSTVARHWAPNLIWFDNNTAMGSISYYVQKLFSLNQGSAVLNHEFNGAKIPQADLKGQVGVGTWYTSAKFDNILVTDNTTGEVLAKDSCNLFSKSKWDFATDGKWKIKNGALTNTTTDMEYTETGSVAYFGEKDWTNYTYTVEATKLEGNEGFLIPFAVQGTDNNIFWNIGGWDNTVSCLQRITDNVKTGQINGTVKDCVIETGKTYKIKVEVNGSAVKCYIDDVLYVDYDFGTPAEAEAYTVASVDDNGDIIIKFVNTTENAKTVAIDIANAKINPKAEVNQVAGDSLQNDNVLGADESTHLTMEEFLLDGVSEKFNYTIPAYSVTSIRLKTIE